MVTPSISMIIDIGDVKMRYKKIVTFKIEASDKKDLETYISSLKGFADGHAIMSRINIAYVTIEPCFEVKE